MKSDVPWEPLTSQLGSVGLELSGSVPTEPVTLELGSACSESPPHAATPSVAAAKQIAMIRMREHLSSGGC